MGVRSTGSQHPTTTEADGHLLEYFRNNFGAGGAGTNSPPGVEGLTASGGNVNEYADGPTVYRSHTFTSTGQFVVSALGSLGNTVDIFLMGGGGGGAAGFHSYGPGSGGGGGGWVQVTSYAVATATYPVTVGAGGGAGASGTPNGGGGSPGTDGGDSVFTCLLYTSDAADE